VDLEHIRAMDRLGELVAQFFSAGEQLVFASLAEGDKNAGFFALWTRKEAYIKARGYGLHYPLDTFSVSAFPRPGESLQPVDDPLDPQGCWGLSDLPAPAGYRAALAAVGLDWHVRHFSFE